MRSGIVQGGSARGLGNGEGAQVDAVRVSCGRGMGEADEIASGPPTVGLTFSASGCNPFGFDCAPDCFWVPGLTLFLEGTTPCPWQC